MYSLGANSTGGTVMTGQLKYSATILISNFRRVVNVAFYLLVDSPAS
jgi:hypothetical protein